MTDNPLIRIYVDKIKNRITFKIKIINMIQQSCVHLFQINHLVNYYILHQKNSYFKRQLIQSFHLLKYD